MLSQKKHFDLRITYVGPKYLEYWLFLLWKANIELNNILVGND